MPNGRQRNNEIIIRLNLKELKRLNNDCKKIGINKSDYIRRLIMNSTLREKPDEEFYELLKELIKIGNTLNKIYNWAEFLKLDSEDFLKAESEKWNNLIEQLRTNYL